MEKWRVFFRFSICSVFSVLFNLVLVLVSVLVLLQSQNSRFKVIALMTIMYVSTFRKNKRKYLILYRFLPEQITNEGNFYHCYRQRHYYIRNCIKLKVKNEFQNELMDREREANHKIELNIVTYRFTRKQIGTYKSFLESKILHCVVYPYLYSCSLPDYVPSTMS